MTKTQNRELVRSDAVLDGERDAHRDLARCTTYRDVSWYRQIVGDNYLHGSDRDRWYLTGYDHTMALAVAQ